MFQPVNILCFYVTFFFNCFFPLCLPRVHPNLLRWSHVQEGKLRCVLSLCGCPQAPRAYLHQDSRVTTQTVPHSDNTLNLQTIQP